MLRRGEETEASRAWSISIPTCMRVSLDCPPGTRARRYGRKQGQRHAPAPGRDIPGRGQGLPAHGKNRCAARLRRGRSTGLAATRHRCRALATMPTPEKGGSHYLTAGPLHFVRAPWTCGSRSSGMIRTASAGQWLRCGQPDADRSCHRSAGVGTWKHTL